MNEEMPIKKEMKMGEIVNKFPETIEVLMNYGIHCMGCGFAFWESLEKGVVGHGIDMNQLLTDLNATVIETRKNQNMQPVSQ